MSRRRSHRCIEVSTYLNFAFCILNYQNQTVVGVRCINLVKRYGDVVAVDGLSLAVNRGECFGLLGPNGAGKTTTIEILEGLLEPDAGEVEVLGLTWKAHHRALRQRLGVQLQETQLGDKLTVEETLRLFRSFYHRGRTLDDLLRIVELESKRHSWVGKLSGGQKQRLAVACALAGDPDLLFLDEPTTGLDPQSRRQLWALLAHFRQQGGTILLTTHYMDEAETLCDRVAIVDHGRVIAEGPPPELIAALGAPKVVTHQGTLEDVFVALTGRHLREE
jgi:ABC-2 type transport system ATP-binding protein